MRSQGSNDELETQAKRAAIKFPFSLFCCWEIQRPKTQDQRYRDLRRELSTQLNNYFIGFHIKESYLYNMSAEIRSYLQNIDAEQMLECFHDGAYYFDFNLKKQIPLEERNRFHLAKEKIKLLLN